MSHLKPILRWLLAATVLGSGTLHFIRPEVFIKIVPGWLPAPRALVLVSGFFEIFGGLGLLVRGTRRAAGWGLAALFVAVFPANVFMATHRIYTDNPWILWGRLPFQAVLIAWAGWSAQPDDRDAKGGENDHVPSD